jgi:hypothetical protein
MRALPFSVWKARRTTVSWPWSAGASRSSSRAARALPMTSSASSRKISRISGSSATLGAGGGGATTGAGAGAGWDRSTSGRLRSGRSSVPRSMRSGWVASRAGAASGSSGSRSTWKPLASKSGSSTAPSRRPMTASSRPLASSNWNMRLASWGWTLSMSMRKPRAPRLLARRSKTSRAPGRSKSISVLARPSTSSRMRTVARAAWSRPSTLSTPRMACSWPGTGISSSRWVGLRKYSSHCFSTSDRLARSSCTTLPRVWRSETRRYRSSIQSSSGSAGWPWATASTRRARRRTRSACSGWSKAASSSAAST